MAQWNKEEAAASTVEAIEEFEAMLKKMTPEQKEAVMQIADWGRKWYNGTKDGKHATGHKALMQHMVYKVKR